MQTGRKHDHHKFVLFPLVDTQQKLSGNSPGLLDVVQGASVYEMISPCDALTSQSPADWLPAVSTSSCSASVCLKATAKGRLRKSRHVRECKTLLEQGSKCLLSCRLMLPTGPGTSARYRPRGGALRPDVLSRTLR